MATSTEQSEFANAIAHYIGYDPRVVYSWAQLETGGHAIGHNWLNLRPYHPNQGGSTDDVGVVGTTSGGFDIFDSVKSAAISSEHRLHQPFAAGIVGAGGPEHTPAEEIAALAASGWDAGHYGGPGGPSIVNVFNSLYPDGKITAPGSSHVVTGGGTQTQSSTLDKLTGTTGSGGPGSVISTGIDGLTSFLKEWVVRGALIILGTGIILVGLYLIVRSLGGPSLPAPAPIKAVAGAVENRRTRRADTEARAVSSARAERAETRRDEAHAVRLKTEQARATELRTRTRHRAATAKQTKAEREAADRRAYIRGAADAEGFPRSA